MQHPILVWLSVTLAIQRWGVVLNTHMVQTKRCTKCNEIKDISEFNKDKNRKDSLQPYCCACRKVLSEEYYKKNKQKKIDYSAKYREKNAKEIKRYFANHRKINHLYWKENNKQNYRKHRDKKLSYNKHYYKNNIETIKRQNLKYRLNKYHNNINFKLQEIIRNAIYRKLRGLTQQNSIWNHLPYTTDELKQHLENQFEPWMNWDNWGAKPKYWAIDHILPQSKFCFADKNNTINIKELQKCWALKNLRPMEFIANIKKGNKII